VVAVAALARLAGVMAGSVDRPVPASEDALNGLA
jgi:hypothetical protein